MIVVDRRVAVGIVLDRLRAEREPRLEELDTQFIRASETNADTSLIVAQKTALRDVTEKDFSKLSLDELASLTLDQALESQP